MPRIAPESKRSVRVRLERDGRWKAFLFRRESLQRKYAGSGGAITDTVKGKAHREAVLEFPPLKPDSQIPSDPSPSGAPRVDASGGIDGAGADSQEPPSGVRALMQKVPTKNDREVINWVKENLINPDIVPEDAPSPFAWALLTWAKDNNGYNLTEFIRTIWRQTLPTAKMMEERAKLKDAREANDELLDRFEKSILKEREQKARKEAA